MPEMPYDLNQVPLHKWQLPWLIYRVSQHLGNEFLIATPDERIKNGWPKVKIVELQNFLLGWGDKPEAGW